MAETFQPVQVDDQTSEIPASPEQPKRFKHEGTQETNSVENYQPSLGNIAKQ